MNHSITEGVLLVNLGSPDSPSVAHVRTYLNQFLMDPRVLDIPWPLRRLLVSLFILPRRPRKTAAAYRAIWSDNGSPLLDYSRRFSEALGEKLDIPVVLSMRYGAPSIEEGVRELALRRGVRRILVLPLYPQFANSTVTTAVDEVTATARRIDPQLELTVMEPFYDRPGYIGALAASIEPALAEPFDHLLFSYHGIPVKHVRDADPNGNHCLRRDNCCDQDGPWRRTCYRAQVIATTRLTAAALNLPEEKHSLAYQSRLLSDAWLRPFTDHEVPRLARSGVKKLLVVCPAFVADNLETLEEIGIRARQAFLQAGGETLTLIPCLNDSKAWVAAAAELIEADRQSSDPA